MDTFVEVQSPGVETVGVERKGPQIYSFGTVDPVGLRGTVVVLDALVRSFELQRLLLLLPYLSIRVHLTLNGTGHFQQDVPLFKTP